MCLGKRYFYAESKFVDAFVQYSTFWQGRREEVKAGGGYFGKWEKVRKKRFEVYFLPKSEKI